MLGLRPLQPRQPIRSVSIQELLSWLRLHRTHGLQRDKTGRSVTCGDCRCYAEAENPDETALIAEALTPPPSPMRVPRLGRLDPRPGDARYSTLPQAAARLGVSHKTLRRLVADGILRAQQKPWRGGFRYLFSSSALETYTRRVALEGKRVEEERHLDRAIFLGAFEQGAFETRFTFGPRDGPVMKYDLVLGLKECWRFACQPIRSHDDAQQLLRELRHRLELPDEPVQLHIHFTLDPRVTEEYLRAVIRDVRPPRGMSIVHAFTGRVEGKSTGQMADAQRIGLAPRDRAAETA